MPNHVANRITFDCSDEKAKEILQSIMYDPNPDDEENTGPGTIDFGKLIPMPKSLMIEAGSTTTRGIEIYLTAVNPDTEDYDLPKMPKDKFDELVNALNGERIFYKYNPSLTEEEIRCTSYDGEIILDGNEPYASIIEDYEEFMETKANGKRVLKIGYLEDQLPIAYFCKLGDSYEIGGLTIYDEGVINGEEDLLRYHASLIGASGPEVIGIYDSDEKLSELNFTDQYRIYCRTYIKESIKIYAMSYFVIPYDGYIGYDLYFCINGVWMKLNANGYYYPGANGILRTPNEWPEGIKYVTDALIELSDVSNDDSSLILALQLALS